jgi:hypothetical protein
MLDAGDELADHGARQVGVYERERLVSAGSPHAHDCGVDAVPGRDSIDPLFTQKWSRLCPEKTSGDESAFSSGIRAAGIERLWSLAGATSGNPW